MGCKHCLRGKSEDKSVSCEVLSHLLANVAEIGQLTLIGGEPSLASRELDNLVYCLRKYGVRVKSFVCYVNGAKHNLYLPWKSFILSAKRKSIVS